MEKDGGIRVACRNVMAKATVPESREPEAAGVAKGGCKISQGKMPTRHACPKRELDKATGNKHEHAKHNDGDGDSDRIHRRTTNIDA